VGSSDDQPPSNAQLVQAIAGFGGGSSAADGLNAGFVNADTSQQPLLTRRSTHEASQEGH
jgi:hypothetical protein